MLTLLTMKGWPETPVILASPMYRTVPWDPPFFSIHFTNIRVLECNISSVDRQFLPASHLLQNSATQKYFQWILCLICIYNLSHRFRFKARACVCCNIDTPTTRLVVLESPHFHVLLILLTLSHSCLSFSATKQCGWSCLTSCAVPWRWASSSPISCVPLYPDVGISYLLFNLCLTMINSLIPRSSNAVQRQKPMNRENDNTVPLSWRWRCRRRCGRGSSRGLRRSGSQSWWSAASGRFPLSVGKEKSKRHYLKKNTPNSNQKTECTLSQSLGYTCYTDQPYGHSLLCSNSAAGRYYFQHRVSTLYYFQPVSDIWYSYLPIITMIFFYIIIILEVPVMVLIEVEWNKGKKKEKMKKKNLSHWGSGNFYFWKADLSC